MCYRIHCIENPNTAMATASMDTVEDARGGVLRHPRLYRMLAELKIS